MNRRGFLKTLGLSTAATVAISNKLTGNTYSTIDDALIKITDNPEDYTTREVRDHHVERSYVGTKLTSSLNDGKAWPLGWELLGYSLNFDSLGMLINENIITCNNDPQPEDAGKNYQLIYRGLDEGSTSSGIVRVIDEEIDRYKTEFTIDYIDNSTGTPVQNQVTFEAPNSVTKMLMGWNSDDGLEYREIQTVEPNDLNYSDFFTNLQNLLLNEENALGLSRIVNRNTPVPVGESNPVYGTLALLDAISQGDVTQQDELYSGVVTLKMVNFGP